MIDKHFTALTPEVKGYLNRIIMRKQNGKLKKPYLLMIDDLGEDHTINRTWMDNPIRELAIRSRNLKFSVMMLYQSVSETLKPLATNADVICAKEMGGVQRELMRKMYAEDLTKEEWKTLCDECWREPWDTLIIDRTPIPRVVFWRNFNERIEVRQDVSEH